MANTRVSGGRPGGVSVGSVPASSRGADLLERQFIRHARADGHPGGAGWTNAQGSQNLLIQIQPSGVAFLNQPNFPRPVPLLQSLLPADGALHRVVDLIPDQNMDVIPLGKALCNVILMLPDPLN